MAMVNIGEVRMRMAQPLMRMPMGMRLGTFFGVMLMLMMSVVNVSVVMGDGVVAVLVLMAFGEMQPHADPHQQGCGPEKWGRMVAKEDDGNSRADEWSRRKIGARPGRPQAA